MQVDQALMSSMKECTLSIACLLKVKMSVTSSRLPICVILKVIKITCEYILGDKSAFVKKSLNQVEVRVPRNIFFRCSRQYIINLRDIEKTEEWLNDGFVVTLNGGKKVEVSRRNALKLKSMLS